MFIEIISENDQLLSWGFDVDNVPAVGDHIFLAYWPPGAVELDADWAVVTQRRFSLEDGSWCKESTVEIHVDFEKPIPPGSTPHSQEWPADEHLAAEIVRQ